MDKRYDWNTTNFTLVIDKDLFGEIRGRAIQQCIPVNDYIIHLLKNAIGPFTRPRNSSYSKPHQPPTHSAPRETFSQRMSRQRKRSYR